ncbi:ROK family protein [Microbacterium gorillae]|uniref:ROK family protein n=1 Tax=Microbacterium gorillae TaxID=1231063 RepID=UPI00058DF694|nr:ROK family protein [Microbacterium gorillae]
MTAGPRLGPGPAVLAFDVGGTDTKSALVDEHGAIRELVRTPTADGPDRPAAVVSAVAELSSRLRAAHPDVRVAATGVVVPGLVDEATGTGVFAANLGWRDVPFLDMLTAALDTPVAFGHDVRSAGRAEVELGAARGLSDVVVMAIGTGIAGAIVLGGRPHAAGGYAGELGHTLADPHGEPCPCGAVGCLETIASAGAIARRYSARTGRTVAGARDVLAASRAGDHVASAVWDDAVGALATHIARLAATIAPEAVVIGGGLAEAGDDLFEPLDARVDGLLSFHRRPRLLRAALGEDAGVLGAALAAREVVSA